MAEVVTCLGDPALINAIETVRRAIQDRAPDGFAVGIRPLPAGPWGFRIAEMDLPTDGTVTRYDQAATMRDQALILAAETAVIEVAYPDDAESTTLAVDFLLSMIYDQEG